MLLGRSLECCGLSRSSVRANRSGRSKPATLTRSAPGSDGGPPTLSGAVIVARGDRSCTAPPTAWPDRGESTPLTPEHRFRLASVSNSSPPPRAASAGPGCASVDDPLCRWIDPCPEAWRPITLHHLLSHQSGVPEIIGRKGWAENRWRDWTLDELAADSARHRSTSRPGRTSNTAIRGSTCWER
jgi:CubicO group peptidase (beta-lactamase class C family)